MLSQARASASDGGQAVSKSEFARLQGVSKAAVSQYCAKGMPVRDDGRIDPAAAEAWLDANINPTRRRAGRAAERGSVPSLAAVRVEGEAHKNEMLRLRLAKTRGELIERRTVERTVFARARLERDAHLNFVVRVAAELAGELGLDERQLFAALDRRMRTHLEELAKTPLELSEDDDDLG